MSNGTEINQDSNVASAEERARDMGWKPKEEFRGDPERWVDAEQYIKRGEEYLPIVQSSNRRLQEKLTSQEARLLDLERINRANAAAMEELQTANREQTVQSATRTIEDIAVQIGAAREAGNVTEELALLREHQEVTDKLAKAKQKPALPQAATSSNGSADMTQTPAFQQFLKDNTWFNTDSVMRAAALQIQLDMVNSGEIPTGASQAERLEKVAQATRKRFGIKDNGRRQAASRVEGGGGGNEGGADGGSGKVYSDLPADAKAACDKAAKRLTFGPGKRHKDVAAWNQFYTNSYFSS